MKYQVMPGLIVPRRARKLSRGESGVMREWYDHNRHDMIATVAFKKGKMIGWCAVVRVKFLWFPTRKYMISVFVQNNLRGLGIGKVLLNKTLNTVYSVKPNALILYGTPEDHDYFNKTYQNAIKGYKLKAQRYFCLVQEKWDLVSILNILTNMLHRVKVLLEAKPKC